MPLHVPIDAKHHVLAHVSRIYILSSERSEGAMLMNSSKRLKKTRIQYCLWLLVIASIFIYL
jgi:hypothetical protein